MSDKNRFRVECPQCSYKWALKAADISVAGCDSAGIYKNDLACPNCKHAQSLMSCDDDDIPSAAPLRHPQFRSAEEAKMYERKKRQPKDRVKVHQMVVDGVEA